MGSEMCIRDRCVGRCVGRVAVDLVPQHPRGGRGCRCTAGARGQPCLLYTSDAADDLLCVDLGGRRIIKKKEHISIHEESHTGTHHSSTPHTPHNSQASLL